MIQTIYVWMSIRYIFDWRTDKERWALEIISQDGAPACTGMMFAREYYPADEKEELTKALKSEPVDGDWYVLTTVEGGTWTGVIPLQDGHPIIRYAGRGDVEWSREYNELNQPDVEVIDTRKAIPGIHGNNIAHWYGHMPQVGYPIFMGYGSAYC